MTTAYTVEMYTGAGGNQPDFTTTNLAEAMKIANQWVAKSEYGSKSKFDGVRIACVKTASPKKKIVTYVFRDMMTNKTVKSHDGKGYVVQCNDSFPLAKAPTITASRKVAYDIVSKYANLVCVDKPSSTASNGYTDVGIMLAYRGHYEWHANGKTYFYDPFKNSIYGGN